MADDLGNRYLSDELARNGIDPQDGGVAVHDHGTHDTFAPETVDNDQDSWLLGVVPPG